MTLFDLARTTDPGTNHLAAADAVASGTVAGHERRILAALREQPGMTSDEIARAAGLERVAAARRMAGLKRKRLVYDGEPRASSISGRAGVTWWVVRE